MVMMAGREGARRLSEVIRGDLRFHREVAFDRVIMADRPSLLDRRVRDLVAQIRHAMRHRRPESGDADEGAKGRNQFVPESLPRRNRP